MDFVNSFPFELIEEIFSYLQPKDLATCSAVSKSWRDATNTSRLWKKFVNDWLPLPNSDGNHIDAINRNLISNNLKSTFSSTLLPPVSLFKARYCQHNFVKHNLANGLYETHHEDCSRFSNINPLERVIYPKFTMTPCFYYPCFGTSEAMVLRSLLLICIGAGHKKVYTLIENVYCSRIRFACVAEDLLVWINGNDVQCIALEKQALEARQIQLIDTLGQDYFRCRYLAMDADNIIAMKETSIKVWCKKTFKSKFYFTPPEGQMMKQCCWFDGFLIFSGWSSPYESCFIQVFNNHALLHPRFLANGRVLEISCNDRIMTFLLDMQITPNKVEVRDKATSSILFYLETITSFHQFHMLDSRHRVIDGYVLIIDNYTLYLYNASTGQLEKEICPTYDSDYCSPINILFDEFIVCLTEVESIEVWNHQRNVKLYNLGEFNIRKIVQVCENRVVAICRDGALKVFSFS